MVRLGKKIGGFRIQNWLFASREEDKKYENIHTQNHCSNK